MKNNIILVLILLFLVSCESYSKETFQMKSKMLNNGKHIEVAKKSTETTHIGILTRHNYGTSHSFEYKFFIEPDEIEWDGRYRKEPKNIIFHQNKIYVRYLKNVYKTTQIIDSLTQDTTYNSYYEVKELAEKSIDRRFFYKMLGSQKWTGIPMREYNTARQKYKEYDIPNDNELVMEINN